MMPMTICFQKMIARRAFNFPDAPRKSEKFSDWNPRTTANHPWSKRDEGIALSVIWLDGAADVATRRAAGEAVSRTTRGSARSAPHRVVRPEGIFDQTRANRPSA